LYPAPNHSPVLQWYSTYYYYVHIGAGAALPSGLLLFRINAYNDVKWAPMSTGTMILYNVIIIHEKGSRDHNIIFWTSRKIDLYASDIYSTHNIIINTSRKVYYSISFSNSNNNAVTMILVLIECVWSAEVLALKYNIILCN